MKKVNCPSCGGEVRFHSNVSVYAVCPYCSSMIVRRDVDVEAIGKMATLPEDMSPLMIGSQGVYQGIRFHLIGRMKIGWKDGTWNEWYMTMENGTNGWVAEAQGFYAVNFEYKQALIAETEKAVKALGKPLLIDTSDNTPMYLPESKVNKKALGSYIFLDRQKFKVVDLKETVCRGSEGELPYAAPTGRRTLSVDLLGHKGEFAAIEIDHVTTRIYVGRYVDWPDLHWQQVRSLENW
jgi:predicted RNA-binding Zn-ribbon protein involved in translation (DUF1610 family)